MLKPRPAGSHHEGGNYIGEFSSGSTFTMLVVLATSCTDSRMQGALQKNADQEPVRHLLRGLTAMLPPLVLKFVAPDESVGPRRCFPHAPDGPSICTAHVADGWVDLRPLKLAALDRGGDAQALYQQLLGVGSRRGAAVEAGWIPTWHFLVRLVEKGYAEPALCGYILWQVAVALDERVCRAVLGVAMVGCAVDTVSEDVTERRMQLKLAAYVQAGRHAVEQEFQQFPMVSLTTDDSNVRGNELNITALVLPSGLGMWAPTQVVDVTCKLAYACGAGPQAYWNTAC